MEKNNEKYANIIVESRTSQTDMPYTYVIPEKYIDLVAIGTRVIIPFGKANTTKKGIIIEIMDNYYGKYSLKKIIDVLDESSIISKDLIELSMWMSDTYLSMYKDSFQTVLPPGNFKEIKSFLQCKNYVDVKALDLTDIEIEILSFINKNNNKLEIDILREKFCSYNILSILKRLIDLDVLEKTYEIKTKVRKKYVKFVKLNEEYYNKTKGKQVIGDRAFKQLEIYNFLLGEKEVGLKTLMKETNSSLTTINSLIEKGIIKIFEIEEFRTPIKKDILEYKKYDLNDDQEKVLNSILENIKNNSEKNKFLIHGITGSGKTEIYLQLVEYLISIGKECIVLVPEISLTPQTINRFAGRFSNGVAVLHSRLSPGERFDQWRKIEEGKVKIVVGARSAIFAPFKNLGLIIIDEEHENSYKSESNPKYDTVEVAEKRCQTFNAFLVLGSATPSLESYYKASRGSYKLLELRTRINNKVLPNINLIDMREELESGNLSIFSRDLYNNILLNLKNKKQTILFLNRRGYSSFVSCRKCGYVVKCDNCDVSLTYHLSKKRMVCHYCGITQRPPSTCPQCGSRYIKYFGIGTEQVEKICRELFPDARISRMDTDTTKKKGSHEKVLSKMKNGNIDILIGTQMIAKGLDFHNVTLVGIIAADTSLNLPDYRASERTFQLITQVAGRAGRGSFKGEVIVQTYTPEHFSIQYAKDHDYVSFYNKEIEIRKVFNYPPYCKIISIISYGGNQVDLYKVTNEIFIEIKSLIEKRGLEKATEIIGPNPAPIEKIKGNYRKQIIFKISNNNLNNLKDIIKWVCIDNRTRINMKNIKLSVTIEPSSLL